MRYALLLLLIALPGRAAAGSKRIVSLMPSYTEIIFAMGGGGNLVGVTNFCDWPPAARGIEKTGDYLRPNAEKVYSLKPDAVFAGAWAARGAAKQLSGLGLKVVSLPEEKSVADILKTVRLIAAELGDKKAGEKLVKELSARMPPGPAGKPLRVYVEADAGGWTTGGLSFMSDAVRLAGGVNVFGKEKRGYFQATWEEVLLMDPEAVILLAGTEEEFRSRPMARDMAAVKAGRVITALDRDAFSRPAPRLFGEIEKLAAILNEKK